MMRKLLLIIGLVISPTFAHDNLEIEALIKNQLEKFKVAQTQHHSGAGVSQNNPNQATHEEEKTSGLGEAEKKSIATLIEALEKLDDKSKTEQANLFKQNDKNENRQEGSGGNRPKFGSNLNSLPNGGNYISGGGAGSGTGGSAGGAGGAGSNGNTPKEATPDNVATAVPEPSTYVMMLAGLMLVAMTAKRRLKETAKI